VNGPKHDLSRDVMGPVMGLRVEKVPGLRVHEARRCPISGRNRAHIEVTRRTGATMWLPAPFFQLAGHYRNRGGQARNLKASEPKCA
jgi:hypothetical protein